MTAIERFKLQLKAIADAIRDKTGSTKTIPFDQIASSIIEIEGGKIPETIILLDDSGNEIAAVRTDEEVEITATANDIRLGTIAITEDGITEGEKEIPSYHTREGYRLITNGSDFVLPTETHYDYTKLQALLCPYNTSLSNSVSVEKVVIDDNLYNVLSTEAIATVKKDNAKLLVDLGISNDSGFLYLLRYFMYKEIY